MINNIRKKVVYLLSIFITLFSYGYINAQDQLKPAVITNSFPDTTEILDALNGGGLTLSKPVLKAGKIGYTNRDNKGSQVVIFSGGEKANLEMDNGVLFSTGDAISDLNSRNENLRASNAVTSYYDYGTKKWVEFLDYDKDLQGIYDGATRNAVILIFDVTLEKHTSALRVAFQFGSEEYPNYVGSQYNDAFGFFVSGPGINGTVNMARNPYNQNTISVNTINGGFVGSSGMKSDTNDLNNTRHYINNGHVTQTTTSEEKFYIDEYNQRIYYPFTVNNEEYNRYNNLKKPVYIEYNGLTKLITYDLTGLQGGETYKFKIAIADAGDTAYDSGVIIQKIQGTTGADLNIKKTVDNMTPNVGDIVEFTLTATNVGPYKGHNVKIEDILPSGYEFISAVSSKKDADYDPITGLWAFETIEAIHEVATLKIKAKVLPTGDYTNKVKITSDEPDPDPTNNEDEVTPDVQKPAAIDLVKTGKVDDTIDGDYGNGVINYTFTITNIGDVPLKDIRLVDTKLPVGTVYNYTGDTNGNGLLDTDEIWIGTATYDITDADTDAEKVENRATVYGKSPKDVEVSAESSDEQGKKQPTITPVEGGGPLMTNPHIYHKVQ